MAERGAEVRIGGRPFRLKNNFVQDLETHRPEETLRRLGKARVIFHAPQDEIVGIDNARRICEAARHPKSFGSLDGADHLLSRREDADYVGRVLAAWSTRYLDEAGGPAAGDASDRAAALPRGIVEASGGAEGTVVAVQAGPHRFGADEPTTVPGGSDTGPDPYGLLLGFLGACTVMTLRLYADRKNWPLLGSRVRLRHERIHADDAGAMDRCEAEGGAGSGAATRGPLIDLIHIDLALEGPDLDETQRARLVEIAHKCPVHRTMTTETRVHVREVDPQAMDHDGSSADASGAGARPA